MLYYIAIYYIVLYHTVLYYIILHCIMLHCMIYYISLTLNYALVPKLLTKHIITITSYLIVRFQYGDHRGVLVTSTKRDPGSTAPVKPVKRFRPT